eukprot:1180627-Prorocentrum_minimum.AAC.3
METLKIVKIHVTQRVPRALLGRRALLQAPAEDDDQEVEEDDDDEEDIDGEKVPLWSPLRSANPDASDTSDPAHHGDLSGLALNNPEASSTSQGAIACTDLSCKTPYPSKSSSQRLFLVVRNVPLLLFNSLIFDNDIPSVGGQRSWHRFGTLTRQITLSGPRGDVKDSFLQVPATNPVMCISCVQDTTNQTSPIPTAPLIRFIPLARICSFAGTFLNASEGMRPKYLPRIYADTAFRKYFKDLENEHDTQSAAEKRCAPPLYVSVASDGSHVHPASRTDSRLVAQEVLCACNSRTVFVPFA